MVIDPPPFLFWAFSINALSEVKEEHYVAGVYLKVSKGAKIRNRYNQVPHLTQDTNGKVTDSQ